MRFLLLLALLILLPVHLQAAEEKRSPPGISLDVQELAPGWWHQMETLPYQQQVQFLDTIAATLQDSFGNSEDEIISKNLKIILQLIKRFKETADQPLDSTKLEDPRKDYSVQQWLELFRLKT